MRLHFTYTNYRGETDKREVIVHHVRHLATDWHPEKQWIMTGFDVNKGVMRDFAMKDMSEVHPNHTLFLMSADVLRQLMGRLNEIQSAVSEVGAGPVDELTRLTGEAKGLVNSIMKGDGDPETVLPREITPEIREVLRMPPWRVTTLADALRAAGHQMSKRHEDATAAVKFLLLHFVLRHGTSWHGVFRKYMDGGVTDGMKYLHTLPGYEEDAKPKPPECVPKAGDVIWPGHEEAMKTCVCGMRMDGHEPLHDGHTPVSMFDYYTSGDRTDG